MKKRIIIAVIVLLVAGVAAWLYWTQEHSPEGSGPLRLYGNVDIREVTLAFRVNGKLEEMLAEEGDMVEKGAVLAKLDTVPYEQRLSEAKASLAAQEARLRQLENGFRKEEIARAEADLDAAKVQLGIAEISYGRQQKLDENDAGTEQLLDEAKAARDRAKAQVAVAQANLDLLQAGYREEDIDQARAALDAGKAKVEQLQTMVDDCVLTAPSHGVIRSRVQEAGAIVSAGGPVFVQSVDEKPWVRAYVSERFLGKIQPGMNVKVFTDSRPEQPYNGHIGFISPVAEFTPKTVQTEALRTDLVYRFRVVLEDPDEQLRQGMPVTVAL